MEVLDELEDEVKASMTNEQTKLTSDIISEAHREILVSKKTSGFLALYEFCIHQSYLCMFEYTTQMIAFSRTFVDTASAILRVIL